MSNPNIPTSAELAAEFRLGADLLIDEIAWRACGCPVDPDWPDREFRRVARALRKHAEKCERGDESP